MSERDNGGPAFPEIIKVDDLVYSKGGLTLRDWLAGQALITLMNIYPTEEAAKYSYKQADAMLKARGE